MTYDDWKTTEPDDIYPASKVPYTCLDCDWRGTGSLKAWNHHQEHHHRIGMLNGLTAVFSCCAGGALRRSA
jgi:hypothetical protein